MSSSLEQLRAQIRAIHESPTRETFQCSLIPSGILRGIMTEIAGKGKTELVMQFLAENPHLQAAWVESVLSLYPCAVLQRHVALDRLLFNEAGKDVPWVTLQLLRSQLFQVVIVDTAPFNLTMLRRLQLTTERANCVLILLSDYLQSAWPIRMQLHVHQKGITGDLTVMVTKQPWGC